MKITKLYAKLHRATVTDANLNYIGSITIDEELLEESGIVEGQKVDVVNVNNGERFSTYILLGERNSGCMCINGAAARKAEIGDKIIVVAYASYSMDEIYVPSVLILDEDNKIQRKTHSVSS